MLPLPSLKSLKGEGRGEGCVRESGPEISLVCLFLFTRHVSDKHLFWASVRQPFPFPPLWEEDTRQPGDEGGKHHYERESHELDDDKWHHTAI